MTMREWKKFLHKRRKPKKKVKNYKPYFLYALELEDGCYYVGISVNVEKRFKKHSIGKGAVWTQRHKPIRIIEVRPTGLFKESKAVVLEDAMTIEYAKMYGEANVRGGKYCRILNPQYPKEQP